MGVDKSYKSPEIGYSSWKYLFGNNTDAWGNGPCDNGGTSNITCITPPQTSCANCPHNRQHAQYKKVDCATFKLL